MKKLVLASAAAFAFLGLAACSDSTDNTTTQSVPATEQPAAPVPLPADPNATTPPATDNTTTQSIDPKPTTGTGGDTQNSEPAPMAPVAPAQ